MYIGFCYCYGVLKFDLVLVIVKFLRVYFFFCCYIGININCEVFFYFVNRCKCIFVLILFFLYNIKFDY